MKVERLKKAQKHLGFYINNYKFYKPYQILIDGTFSYAALQNKFNILEQLPKYFQAEVKLLTTQCVILETEKLGPKLHGTMLIVKQFAVHKCGHEKQPVTGSKCLRSMIASNNPSRYIVATQDRSLQDQLRKVPGSPIMYLHGKAPNLEAPSAKDKEFAEALRQKSILTDTQVETIKILKEQSGLKTDVVIPKRKKKHKGPNPLSCKRKKKKDDSNVNKSANKINSSGKVRKRKRVKLPSHVKEVLKSNA